MVKKVEEAKLERVLAREALEKDVKRATGKRFSISSRKSEKRLLERVLIGIAIARTLNQGYRLVKELREERNSRGGISGFFGRKQAKKNTVAGIKKILEELL